MTYMAYVNKDGRAVAKGLVTAETLAEAKAEVVATGLAEKDFILIRKPDDGYFKALECRRLEWETATVANRISA